MQSKMYHIVLHVSDTVLFPIPYLLTLHAEYNHIYM